MSGTTDYKYIRAWGKHLGSFNYYIDGEVLKARKDNAPQNAIYKNSKGNWQTFDDIKSDNTKKQIQRTVDSMK